MRPSTARLWELQDRHGGDRARLFTAVASVVGGSTVLYPGSFVDVAASVAWPSVTYVDVDRRAPGFFDDTEGIAQILQGLGPGAASAAVRFVHADYTTELPLVNESFDVLISLYAGFVSEHCTRYLRIGGTLLVNPSHGDVAMASIDDRYRLSGVVTSRSGRYTVRTDDLEGHLVPKRDVEVTAAALHASGRGVAYTRSPFAYLFERRA